MIYKKFQYASLCSFLRNLFWSQHFLFGREVEPVKHNRANLAGCLSFMLRGPSLWSWSEGSTAWQFMSFIPKLEYYFPWQKLNSLMLKSSSPGELYRDLMGSCSRHKNHLCYHPLSFQACKSEKVTVVSGALCQELAWAFCMGLSWSGGTSQGWKCDLERDGLPVNQTKPKGRVPVMKWSRKPSLASFPTSWVGGMHCLSTGCCLLNSILGL